MKNCSASFFAAYVQLRIIEAQMFNAEGADPNGAFIPSKSNPYFGEYLRADAHLQRLIFLQNGGDVS